MVRAQQASSVMSRIALALALVLASSSATALAQADDDPKAARDEFVRGAQLVKDADWAGALAAFESSGKLKTHPVTTYNIGACLRAMGQYTRARKAFATSLEENGKAPGADLSPGMADEIRRYVVELDRLLATLDLVITPDEAQIAIDGRPLEPAPASTQASARPPSNTPPWSPARCRSVPQDPRPKGDFASSSILART